MVNRADDPVRTLSNQVGEFITNRHHLAVRFERMDTNRSIAQPSDPSMNSMLCRSASGLALMWASSASYAVAKPSVPGAGSGHC